MHGDLTWQSMPLEKVKRKNLFSSQKAVCSSDSQRAVDSKHRLWAYAGGKLTDWGVNPALCSPSAQSWGAELGQSHHHSSWGCWCGLVAATPCPDMSPGRGEAAEWQGAASESWHLLGQGSFLISVAPGSAPLTAVTWHRTWCVYSPD